MSSDTFRFPLALSNVAPLARDMDFSACETSLLWGWLRAVAGTDAQPLIDELEARTMRVARTAASLGAEKLAARMKQLEADEQALKEGARRR